MNREVMRALGRLSILLITLLPLRVTPPAMAAGAAESRLLQVRELQETLADVADRVRQSVVAIRADRRIEPDEDPDAAGRVDSGIPDDEVHRRLRDRLWPSVGSGIVLDTAGSILTNEHVIRGAEPQNIEVVAWNGETFQVVGITSDPRSDLAVLRIENPRDLVPARLGDLSRVRQGHFAIVIGNPFGSATENSGRTSMSFGIISALGQDLTQKLDLSQQRYYGNLLQTDARINPGNSGGPLLNIDGEVIGITTAISTRSGASEGVGYAISMDARIKNIIEQLRQGREIEYGFIGVQLDRPSPAQRRLAGSPSGVGVLIREVSPGAPAEGLLQPGDIVVAFNDEEVRDVDHLIRLVSSAPVGKPAEIRAYRNGHLITTTVTPARRAVLKGVRIEAPLAWRGMTIADLTDDLREKYKLGPTAEGVVVTQVEADGPAGRVGLKEGSLIRRVADQTLTCVRQLRDLLPRLQGPVPVETGEPATEITLP